jgi:YfiH family protein
MPFDELNGLRLFRFESLRSTGLVHALFTRRGGVSPVPWASLNVGAMVGDEPDRVSANRRLSLEALGLPAESVFDVWQVHSADVVLASGPRREAPAVQGDGIVTDRGGISLMMRFADCVPILLFDPVRRSIGIVHAGWLGTVRQIVRQAIVRMMDEFGSRPADVRAGIGPSIAAHHYPVGPEVVESFRKSFGADAEPHLTQGTGGTHLDLWSATEHLLRREGVEQVEVAGLCTACDTEDWYSHRAEGGRTGRFGAVIALAA